MRRILLYSVIGLLAVGILVVGYLYYRDGQGDVDVRTGEHNATIEEN